MKTIEVVAACFYRFHQGKKEVLIFQRNEKDKGGGLWEFPGGKIEDHEDEESALKREILEELGVECVVEKKIGKHIHIYPEVKVMLQLFLCTPLSWDFQLTDHQGFAWVNENSIQSYPLAEADIPLIKPAFQSF